MSALFSPAVMILLRWTVLLALGWIAHGVLRKRHSRWRLILWRSILCFALVLPLMQFAPVPGIRIPIDEQFIFPAETTAVLAQTPTANPTPRNQSVNESTATSVQPSRTVKSSVPPPPQTPLKTTIRRGSWFIILWAFGAVLAGLRLARLQFKLNCLTRESRLASPAIQQLLRGIQSKLGVRRTIGIRVSGVVCSPFACGVLQPIILLPQRLVQEISGAELTALLAHEIAHFRRNDLFWCVAWRWTQGLFWFHPLAWKIPAAHNLACEEEADRIASGEVQDRGFYSQLLARLALRVLAMPEVETRLALNGAAQIAQRLKHLRLSQSGAWTWRHSAAGFAVVALMFLLAAGCEVSSSHQQPYIPAKVEFKNVVAVVQDEDGRPIAGASIKPIAFRVKGIHGADWYGWHTKVFGPAENVTTGPDGKALLKYPVLGIPEEKEFTGALILMVDHPQYSRISFQNFKVDETNAPIRLTRGIPLSVTGYFGGDHQPVRDLVANLSQDGVLPEDWQKTGDGGLSFHKLSPGNHVLQIMGRLGSGQIVYSETLDFTAEKGKPCQFNLEMKPGIRLEGKVEDSVARPVKNGRVMISIRPKEFPALNVIEDFVDSVRKYGAQKYFWQSYRPISEDGTFVFESVPPGEVDVVVLGDGFSSKSNVQLQFRVNGILQKGPVETVPQVFPLTAPVTRIEVKTEPTATLDFSATTKSGKPIAGVGVGMYPRAFRMTGIYGWNKQSSEEPFREIPHLSEPVFWGRTDANGKLVIKNIPAETWGLEVGHPTFQAPLQDKVWRDRHIRASFSMGVTNHMKLALESKGSSFIGESR